MELSVVIPVFNEAAVIEETVGRVIEAISSRHPDFELVVVDDGSRDGTRERIRRCLAEYPSVRLVAYDGNRGKGHAIRIGVAASTGEYVLLTDADLSTPLEELDPFLAAARAGGDVVIGNRKAPQARILRRQPWFREMLGKGYTWVANRVLGTRVSDFTCGFKLFRGPAARQIFQQMQIERWSYDAEALFLAHRYGYQVQELPVRWKNDPHSKVRLPRDTVESFVDLLRIRWYALRGGYKKPADCARGDAGMEPTAMSERS